MINRLFLLIFVFVGCSENYQRQKIYHNAVIWTGESNIPKATAIVVQNQYIVFVGNDEDAFSFADENAIKIDLKGRFVTPGLIDNHVHFMSGGLQLQTFCSIPTNSMLYE